jgi:tetratricopeptide (TPR) repeat protein
VKAFSRHTIPLLLCFLVAIAFSLKNVREPDLWWQLKTGEWILEHKQVPQKDVFSYTFEGKPWINIKWGSEVLYALVSEATGPECIFLIQLVISCLLLYILYLLCLYFSDWFGMESPDKKSFIIFSLLLALYGLEFRIIGRPEMFSHLFTALFFLLLLRHQRQSTKEIFWLVPLQLAWANMHEAFGTGVVLMLLFSGAAWFNWWYGRKQKFEKAKPVLLSLATLLSIAGIIVNPNGAGLLLRPFNIFGQVFENKFTTELMDYTSYLFWQKEAYIAVSILVISLTGLLLFFRSGRNKNEKLLAFMVRENLTATILVMLAFVYLASTAYRNIAFWIIVAIPLFSTSLTILFAKIRNPKIHDMLRHLYLVNILIGVLLYVSVVSGQFYKWYERNDRYGLEIVSNINPGGAADFILKNKLQGHAFCDYLTSSYLLWKLYPEFKSFIDLRDLDVFDNDFFYRFAEAINDGDVFRKLDSTYHFRYAVVLANPQFSRLLNYLYTDSTYSLAFVDAVATVFVKQREKNNTHTITPTGPQPQSKTAFALSKLFNPFYHTFDYVEVDNNLLAASFFNMLGRTDLVKNYTLLSSRNAREKYQANELLGQVYFNLASADTVQATSSLMLDSAKYYLHLCQKENSAYVPAYMDFGAIAFHEQHYKDALKNFEKAASFEKNNLNAHLYAGRTLTVMANQSSGSSQKKYMEAALEHYEKADRLNPNNPLIMSSMGFLYFRLNDCEHAVLYLDQVKDFEGLPAQERAAAKECLSKCGH